jgi:hypothetical protein
MKSANLAWRLEPVDTPAESPPEPPREAEPRIDAVERMRARARFDRRTIEIREQGFAPFRVR